MFMLFKTPEELFEGNTKLDENGSMKDNYEKNMYFAWSYQILDQYNF